MTASNNDVDAAIEALKETSVNVATSSRSLIRIGIGSHFLVTYFC